MMWVEDYKRILRVCVKSSESESFRIESGVKQGCVVFTLIYFVRGWGNKRSQNGIEEDGSEIFRRLKRMKII